MSTGYEEATPAAPVQDPSLWPAPAQLEKWLMQASAGGDDGAQVLRKILLMNPSYGAYLTTDEDLADIVQVAARRMRSTVGSLRGPMTNTTLFPDLCEAVWRTVGYVLNAILHIEEQQLPLPEAATGQVKMLLKSNEELSKRFNSARRQWLRELSLLRDQQRRISSRTERSLATLVEEPIYFFEPLCYFLDESTKEFICATVEERIKMEMKKTAPKEDEMELIANAKQLEEMEKLVAVLEAENRRLRNECGRQTEEARRYEDKLRRAKIEEEEAKKHLRQREQEVANLTEEVENLRAALAEGNRRIAALEAAAAQEGDGQDAYIKELNDEIERQVALAATNAQEAAQLRKRMAELEAELNDLRNRPRTPEPEVVREPEVKERIVVEERIVEKIITADDPELSRKIDKYMAVETELRNANKELERALKEQRDLVAMLQEQLRNRDTPNEEPKKPQRQKREKAAPTGYSQDEVDKEIQDAITKLTAQHNQVLKQHEDEIARLNAELRRLRAAPAPQPVAEPPKPAPAEPPKKEVVIKETVNMDEENRLRAELEVKQAECEELRDEISKLEQQVQLLLDKLKEIGGAKAVEEMQDKFKALKPKRDKKPRKMTAFERLWEDAKRRIADMKARQAVIEQKQEVAIFRATRYVRDKRSLQEVVNLTHLQKASAATAARFNDAYEAFMARNETAGGEEGVDEEGNATNAYAQAALAATSMKPVGGVPPDPEDIDLSARQRRSLEERSLTRAQLDVCKALLRQEESLMEQVLMLKDAQAVIDKFLAGHVGHMVVGKSVGIPSPGRSPSPAAHYRSPGRGDAGAVLALRSPTSVNATKGANFAQVADSPFKFAPTNLAHVAYDPITSEPPAGVRRPRGFAERQRASDARSPSPEWSSNAGRPQAAAFGALGHESLGVRRLQGVPDHRSKAPEVLPKRRSVPITESGDPVVSGLDYMQADTPGKAERHTRPGDGSLQASTFYGRGDGALPQRSGSEAADVQPRRRTPPTAGAEAIGGGAPWLGAMDLIQETHPRRSATDRAEKPSKAGDGSLQASFFYGRGDGALLQKAGSEAVLRRPAADVPSFLNDDFPWSRRPAAAAAAPGLPAASPSATPTPQPFAAAPVAASATSSGRRLSPERSRADTRIRTPPPGWNPTSPPAGPGLSLPAGAGAESLPALLRRGNSTPLEPLTIVSNATASGASGTGGGGYAGEANLGLASGLENAHSPPFRPGQLQEIPPKPGAVAGRRLLTSSAPQLPGASGELPQPGMVAKGGGVLAPRRQGDLPRSAGGSRFLVTPMVSQQSISAGHPMPWEQEPTSPG